MWLMQSTVNLKPSTTKSSNTTWKDSSFYKYSDIENYDVASLAELFLEAAETMTWLPRADRKASLSYWPDFHAVDFLNFADSSARVRITPTADQIDRFTLACHLTLDLDEEDRKLIWAVAPSGVRRHRGPQWKKLGKLYHCNAQTVKNNFEKAIINLWYTLQ